MAEVSMVDGRHVVRKVEDMDHLLKLDPELVEEDEYPATKAINFRRTEHNSFWDYLRRLRTVFVHNKTDDAVLVIYSMAPTLELTELEVQAHASLSDSPTADLMAKWTPGKQRISMASIGKGQPCSIPIPGNGGGMYFSVKHPRKDKSWHAFNVYVERGYVLEIQDAEATF